MKTIKPTKAWILICSIIAVSNATEHGPPPHDGSHLGDSAQWKKYQNTIVPVGVQTPDHVLSAPDLSCISADNNIFDIMNQAQEKCNGTDMRCTFYHFLNHSYNNIGVLDIDKERFDDLLMKFDNWLLTDEDIEKNGGKIKEEHVFEAASVGVNENSSITSDLNGTDASQGLHVDIIDHSTNESDSDRVNSHHIKAPHEIHHKNRHSKDHNSDIVSKIKKHWKDTNHIVIEPEYNSDHKYFEVYIPKDKITGKPRTIYVEVDRDKNEFVLLDEEIDKKLKGVKPIRIELDELSEIADTAFNEVSKSSKFKEHLHNHLDDDEEAMISDISTGDHEHEIHVDDDVDEEHTENNTNPYVHHPNIFAIDAKQLLIPDDKTGKDKKVLNVIKNQIVPNKYINQAQFQVETHLDNATDHHTINDNFELLESSNETESNQSSFHEEHFPRDTIEYDENNIDLNLKRRLNTNTENSSIDYSDISYENDSNKTEYHDLPTDHENVTINDDDFIELEEHNDTFHDIDYDDNHDISASHTFDLNESTAQIENPIAENTLKPFNKKPELTPPVSTEISDYSGLQFHAIPTDNRRKDLIQNLSLEPPRNISPELSSPYDTVPISGKNSTRTLKSDSHLPSYADIDLPTGDSQITTRKSDVEHPTICSYGSPIDSYSLTPSAAPKISLESIFPSPPVECVVKLNTDSKSSPFNFGFSWLPSYSRIEELRLPSASNPLTLDRDLPNSVSSLPIDRGLPENSVSLVSVPCMEYSGNSQSSVDRTTPIKDSSIIHYAPSNPLSSDRGSPSNSVPLLPVPSMEFSGKPLLSLDRTTPVKYSSNIHNTPSVHFDIQEPSLATTPCESETVTPMSPKYILLSKLGLPKSNTDFDRMSSSTPVSVMPCSFKDAVSSYNLNQQIPSHLQQNIPNPIDLGFNNKSPFDKNSKDTMIPCPPCTNRYPYSISPCFSNPYLRPTQFIPSYMESALPINPFQSSKPILDSSPKSLDNCLPWISEDYSQDTKPIPFLPLAPNTQFSPLNLQPLRPNFPPNAVPCPNVWNNIPYVPYTDQHIRNYPPFVSNYFTPTTDQTHKPLHLKEVPISMLEHPCLSNNNFAIAPHLPIHTPPIQKDLNPSLALEHDLENLSLKYGISLTNILHSLEKEISDTCLSNLDVPHSKLKLDNNLQFKSTNANIDDLDRNGYEELHFKPRLTNMTPLDSTLKGPHLNLGNPLMLDANQFQGNLITSENTRPVPNQNFKIRNQPTNLLHDSSLIGPQLSTSSSNILYSDENRNVYEMDVSESDSSNLMYLDSSLTGPHLKIGRPSMALGSILPQGDILTSQTNVPITVLSQIRPKLNQNQYTKLLLDTSSIGSHLPSISAVKPLSTNEIQNMNEMVPLDSELTDLTPIDIPPGDFGNEFDKSGNVQHEKSTVAITPNPKLQKPTGYWPTNLVGKELLLKDSSTFKPLDYSLIGSEIETGNLPIIADYVQHKNNPVESQYNLHNSDTIHEENIIVPSLLAPTSLNKPINTDLNLNIISQSTKSNENPPVTDISKTSFKETDFKIVEPTSNIHDNNILPSLSKDSEMSTIDAKTHLDSSLIGQNLLPNTQTPVMSSSFDSSIHLDNSLVGPSILNKEIDSQSPSSGHQLDTATTNMNHNIKPSYNKGFDSNYYLDNSFIGPSLNQEMKSQRPTITDSFTQLDRSLIPPSLNELESETSSVSNADSQLDSSLTMPSLNIVESSTSPSAASSNLNSSLIGPSLKPVVDSSEVSRVFDPKKIFDSSLLGPHLTTTPFSNEINEKLRPQSNLASVKVIDSSLTGPHLDYANQFDQSDSSRNHNPESYSTSEVVPGILETTNFLNYDLIEDSRKPSIHSSDLKELLRQFKNSITKSQLSASESKPCDKLLSSIAKQTSDNTNTSPTCSDLQSLNFDTPMSLQDYPVSEYSPITTTYPKKVFPPVRPIVKDPCLETNNYPTPQMLSELLPYAQGVTPILPCLPFVQKNPSIDGNWITPKYLKILNSNQALPGLRPTELSTEDLKLLDLTSQSQIYPQLSMYSEDATAPSSEWTRPSNILPIDKYMTSQPKSVLISSNLGSTISNPDYSPKLVDVMSLLDENSYKLLQDMSILPLSQSSLAPNTVSNAMVLPSMYVHPQTGLYYPQNIPYMIPTPNKPPCNLQPYSQIPSESKFSEIVGPIPKIESLPSESLKPYLQSQLHEIPHTPQFTESIPNPREFLPQPLSELYLESPSSSIDTVLQSSTASNGSNRIPWQSSPVYSTSISPITLTLSNAFTSPMSPSYTSSSLVSYAKPILASTTSLPVNVLHYTPVSLTSIPPPICPSASVLPLTASPLTPAITCKANLPIHVVPYAPISLTPFPPPICPYSASVLPFSASPLTPLPVIPYTAKSVQPVSSSPLRSLKTIPVSNYPYTTTAVQTRPISSAIPCKPSQMYPNPYLPALPCPLPLNNGPYSPAYTSQLLPLPAKIKPEPPVFYEPVSIPYSPVPKPKSLSNVASPAYFGPMTPITARPMVSIPSGILTPTYSSPDISTYNYSPIPSSINTLTNPSNAFSPAFISPVTSILPAYNRLLPSKPVFNLKPTVTTQKLENLKLLNTLPIFYANNPFLNANQMLSASPNILIQNQQVPKWSRISSSQVKQNKPSEYRIGSNLQIIEGTPSGAVEENMYTYSNVMGDKYYKEPNFKYPLESLSSTLAPSELRETLPFENLIQQKVIPCTSLTSLASESILHPQSYQGSYLTPYTPLYGKPCLVPQKLLPSSLIETVPQNIFNNIPVEPPSGPFKRPISKPAPIFSSSLLKPLSPFTPAATLPSAPCIDTSLSPYNTLQIHNKPMFSSPYTFTSVQDISTPPIDPARIRKIISSQYTPVFSQFSTNAPSVTFASPISTPKSSIPSRHYNLDNYIELPLTVVKPSTVLNFNQYSEPIISRNTPSQIPITCPYISSLTTAEILKKPLICPKYISSSLPAQTILQNSIPFYEAPINYQPYIPIPTALTSSANTIVKIPSATLPYTVLPSVNLVEPLKTGRNNPQWSSFSSQNSLPVSSLPVPNPSIFISPSSSRYSTITPIISKPALSNPMIPSSLLVSSNADFRTPLDIFRGVRKSAFRTPLKISSSFNNIPRYSYPLPALTEPLQIAPYVTASKLLGPPILSQNLLQPITQYSNGKYTAPLLSSSYLTQPLEMIDSYPIEPFSNVQYASKPCQKLSPISAQYVCPSSSPAYNSLPSQTTPISQTNNPRVPQYSTPTASVYNIPSYSSLLAKNPFLNPNLKPEVAPYPVSNNEISSLKLTPSESMLLSNLTPLDISQEAPQSYSSPITSSSPLFMSSLLKPLSNMLPQNPGLYQSQIIPINSQYISQSPTLPQLLPSTSPLLESSLLKPLLTNSQNYSPSVPMSNFQNYSPSVPLSNSQNYSPSVTMPFSNSNTAFPENSPITLSSDTSNQVNSGPELPMSISELVEAYGPINPPSATPYSFLKTSLYKQNQSPIYMPSYSNYNLQGTSPNLPVKANNINTVKPVEVSASSSAESSRLSVDAETVEETKPYELMSNIKETLSKLPPNQQRQYYPGLMSKYLVPMPQSTLSLPKYPTLRPKLSFPVPSVIPEDVELIDTKDFNPLLSTKSESLLSDYSAVDRNAPTTNRPSHYQEINTLPSSSYNVLSNTDFSSPIFKQLLPEPLQNIPTKISELDMSQFFPYTTLNTDSSPFSYNQLPSTKQQQNYVNQRPQQSPVYQSSKEYKEITQSLSPFQISSSSAYIEPQLTSSLIRGPSPMPETPLYIEPMSETTENNVPLPTFTKYSPLPETPVETNPEIENIQTLLNNYRYFNKITPQEENSYVYEPKSATVEVPIKLNSVNPLIKTKEAYAEYIKDSESNAENNYTIESDNKNVDENKPYSFEPKATNSLTETIKDFNVPDYSNYKAQRPQRLSNLELFYANNHIGKTPQFYTVPTYNTLPKDSTIDVASPSITKYPEILKDLTNIPTKYFGSGSKLDTTSIRPSEYYPELAISAENAPNTKSYPQNYLSPYAETKLPTNLVTETSEIPPTSFAPYNNINDIKYSGYKTYQLPSLKSPKTLQNVGTPAQIYNPSFVQYVPPNLAVKSSVEYQQPNAPTNRRIEISEPVIQTKLSLDTLQESPKYNSIEHEIAAILAQYQAQQNTAQLQSNLGLNTLAESTELNKFNTIENEPVISRYQTPEKLTSPVYSKLGFDTSEEIVDFNDYGTTKDEPVGIDSINNLKTSLINYITKRDEIKNNLDSNNQELTIPLGNIAIVKKEPYDADTIKTNDPSIGLKVWKSNVKIVQAELSLKYKDLSVVNFMPIVNNIDKYDMDEIRKIVKNYIDEKYGHHIEIKEPYNVDNQYTVIKDFDHNAVSNKYNLLWPTNYV